MKKYRTILIDPPWRQIMAGQYKKSRHKRPDKLPYPTMTIKQIKSLPISELSDVGCHLWLWTTNQFLHEGFHIMEAWGYNYLCPIHWKKPSGLGNYFIHLTQTCLFGYFKKCDFPAGRYKPNFIESKSKLKHSRKPVESYELIESISIEPRLEIFARSLSPMFNKRDGWDVWGNEVETAASLTQALTGCRGSRPNN